MASSGDEDSEIIDFLNDLEDSDRAEDKEEVEIDDLEFIELYRNHTCLYDTTSKEYKNRNIRNRAYNSLAKNFKCSLSKYCIFFITEYNEQNCFPFHNHTVA